MQQLERQGNDAAMYAFAKWANRQEQPKIVVISLNALSGLGASQREAAQSTDLIDLVRYLSAFDVSAIVLDVRLEDTIAKEQRTALKDELVAQAKSRVVALPLRGFPIPSSGPAASDGWRILKDEFSDEGTRMLRRVLPTLREDSDGVVR